MVADGVKARIGDACGQADAFQLFAPVPKGFAAVGVGKDLDPGVLAAAVEPLQFPEKKVFICFFWSRQEPSPLRVQRVTSRFVKFTSSQRQRFSSPTRAAKE